MLNFTTMKAIIVSFFSVFGLIFCQVPAFCQFEIKHRLYPDGSMLYYIEPVNFYWTDSKNLKGGVVTDKENYYIALQPFPFPKKNIGNKLKDELEVKLSNDSSYHLKHFDTRYMQHDSVMQLLYLIDPKSLKDFNKLEVLSAKINMGEAEGIRTYFFKLHKSAIREQLNFFLNEGVKKKKK